MSAGMVDPLPFRDINVHASPSQYAFTSPSAPSAPTLVVDRPSGDLRLIDGTLLGAKRVSSIAGILGIIKLRLGTDLLTIYSCAYAARADYYHRQVHNSNHESSAYGPIERPYGLQSHCNRVSASSRACATRPGRRYIPLPSQESFESWSNILLILL